MSTVQQVVTRALRLLRVIDGKQPVKPYDMTTGIEALNTMMRQWESLPLPMGWQDVSNPSDEMPTLPEADKAIAFNLALELRPEYGSTLDQDVIAQSVLSLSYLRRQYAAANPLEIEGGFGLYHADATRSGCW
jgi:hypothetical protein